MTLDKIYEDQDILVINKPSGLVVNTSLTSKGVTLQEAVSQDIDFSESDEESEFFKRGGIVHRLDKDTSGIVLIAKNELAFEHLQSQFKNREVHKTYIAHVLGEIKEERAEIDAPIARHPKVRTRFCVTADGKPAYTKFEKAGVYEIDGEKVTILKVFPITGRTHQIRVHMTALNHPIISDPIYMTRKQYEFWTERVERLLLHALSIQFKHPTSGETVTFSSELPSIMFR